MCCNSDDREFRDSRLKLIPRVVEGNWTLQEGVGNTPAILGTKVSQRYYRGNNFFEVDYDIGSSSVASGIVRLLLGYSKDLVIDLGLVLEGKTCEELPERILACVRLSHLDVQQAVPFERC